MQLAGVFDEESSRQHSVQANLTQAQRFSGRSGPAGYAWKRLAEGLLLTGMGDIWGSRHGLATPVEETMSNTRPILKRQPMRN
jgi:hypothetical protein